MWAAFFLPLCQRRNYGIFFAAKESHKIITIYDTKNYR